MTLLAMLSLVGAAALFIALAAFLFSIVKVLEDIGGTTPKNYGNRASLLSKIRMGLRAIEVQTGAIAPAVTQLNGGLSAVRDGLGAIDANLGKLITAVSRQGGSMTNATMVPEAVFTIWRIALILTFLVFIPLSLYLLQRTWVAARGIQQHAADSLAAAAGIAGGTQHIPALDATIGVAGEILVNAREVAAKLGTVADVVEERAR